MIGRISRHVLPWVLLCSTAIDASPLQIRDKISMDIQSWTALGDSYAAGVEAGDELDSTCWRYSDSYPGQLNRSEVLGSNHTFDFLACSGALMQDASTSSSGSGSGKAIQKQIDNMAPADFATVSIGGNDAGFYKLLDGCLFMFQGPAAHDCKAELKASLEVIASDDFAKTYNGVMDAILEKNTADTFRIFANGYSPFFDDELSDDCNDKSLGYWNLERYRPKLTVDVRRQLNDVCNKLNARIKEVISSRKDNKVIHVDWAHRFDGHRFCQPGKEIEDGDNTYFFDIQSRTKAIGNIDVKTCEADAEASGDWGEMANCGIARAHSKDSSLKPYKGSISTNGGDLTGPGTARVFHPKPQGYAQVVAEIEQLWPYTASGKDVGPKINCDAAGDTAGSVDDLEHYLDSFCGQDLSVSHTQSYIDDGVKYTLGYKNPGSGYCNAGNCKSAFKSGFLSCKYNSHNSIFSNGNIPISCGKFSWKIETAPEPSAPACGELYTAPVSDVKKINDKLTARGDGELCCTSGTNGCVNIETSGDVAVDLCTSATEKLCVTCARLGNYLAGLTDKCTKEGKVSGMQDITETKGLNIQI